MKKSFITSGPDPDLCIPINVFERVSIGPPAKRHCYGVSLAGRWWPDTVSVYSH